MEVTRYFIVLCGMQIPNHNMLVIIYKNGIELLGEIMR